MNVLSFFAFSCWLLETIIFSFRVFTTASTDQLPNVASENPAEENHESHVSTIQVLFEVEIYQLVSRIDRSIIEDLLGCNIQENGGIRQGPVSKSKHENGSTTEEVQSLLVQLSIIVWRCAEVVGQ